MRAFILCGGLGTRLRSVVSHLPKCLAPIRDKPFLYYLLKHLEDNAFTNITLCSCYKSDKIYECFGNRFGKIKLSHSIQNRPEGTGKALRKAAKEVPAGTNRVLIVNGDTWWPIRYHEMIAYHDKVKAKVTVGTYEDIIAGTFVADISFLKTLKEKHFEDNIKEAGIFESTIRFIDIGTPQDYSRAQLIL